MTLLAALTLSPSEYVWPGFRVSWIWSSPTNLAESTEPSLISFSAAGVRRMRLKSMYLRGLTPRPSCSLCHVNRDVSLCGNGHHDVTPHGSRSSLASQTPDM